MSEISGHTSYLLVIVIKGEFDSFKFFIFPALQIPMQCYFSNLNFVFAVAKPWTREEVLSV